MSRYVVTGGAGFIGSALCHLLLSEAGSEVIAVDKMTYAANPATLAELNKRKGFRHARADVCNAHAMRDLVAAAAPDVVFHLAAETHVDRSIDGPADFISTNLLGTYAMLEAARDYWTSLSAGMREAFRFVHVSTDEVFGSLGAEGVFTEASQYDPSSPYSASKAGADHLARAWHRTYGLPVVVSNCSNNYGPRQFPEKLIPLMVLNAIEGQRLPIYGDGSNVRDWLYVEDHAQALQLIAGKGAPGEVYCVGGRTERTNMQIVQEICRILDERRPLAAPHEALIELVEDRPAHDHRYAIDPSKIERELGWAPTHDFKAGLEATVDWYLSNEAWWRDIRETRYRGERLGRRT